VNFNNAHKRRLQYDQNVQQQLTTKEIVTPQSSRNNKHNKRLSQNRGSDEDEDYHANESDDNEDSEEETETMNDMTQQSEYVNNHGNDNTESTENVNEIFQTATHSDGTEKNLNSSENIVIEVNASICNNGKKYQSLTKEEINQLMTYARKTFFRRCKFVNNGILHSHLNTFFKHMMISDPNMKTNKTCEVIKCVKDTLSSRRGYSTTLICNKMRGTLIRSK